MAQDIPYNFERRPVRLSFRLGEISLFFKTFDLDVFDFSLKRLLERTHPLDQTREGVDESADGLLYRSALTEQELPRIQRVGGLVRYVPQRFTRYYVDLSESWESYLNHFSSKTRSTLRRKARRFAEIDGGEIDWREYRTRDEMKTFYNLARQVSAKTYQERLLHVGLPDSDAFEAHIQDLAEQGKVLGYLLFIDGEPVSYLYLPVSGETVLYAHLGYDPGLSKHSPGTVLMWVALERLFADPGFRYFDFMEGESDHKKLFSDHELKCADVYFLKSTLANNFWLKVHSALGRISNALGALLTRLRLKKFVKNLVRTLARAR